jgi:hypothetical protein
MKEIPYIVFESEMVRLERFIKKLFILIVILIVLLFGTNIYWIYYESQFEEVVTTEVTQDNTDGYNNYVGNDGDITNGETNSKDN